MFSQWCHLGRFYVIASKIIPASSYAFSGRVAMKKNRLISRMVDLPDENLPLQPVVELCGLHRVLIENHKGVTEYSQQRIAVAVSFGGVVIEGEHLHLCRISTHQLVVKGQIQNIMLCRG